MQRHNDYNNNMYIYLRGKQKNNRGNGICPPAIAVTLRTRVEVDIFPHTVRGLGIRKRRPSGDEGVPGPVNRIRLPIRFNIVSPRRCRRHSGTADADARAAAFQN